MSILGIDYGASRVGIALVPDGVSFASPLCVIENKGSEYVLDEIQKIITEERVGEVVVGVPYTLADGVSEQTKEVQAFIQQLENHISIPVHTEDERLSSRLAETYQKQGADKSLHDALAAMAIVQTYVDRS